MSSDTVFTIGVFFLIILCTGDPDLLDALVHNLYRE